MTTDSSKSSYPIDIGVEYPQGTHDQGFMKGALLFRIGVFFRFIMVIPASIVLLLLTLTFSLDLSIYNAIFNIPTDFSTAISIFTVNGFFFYVPVVWVGLMIVILVSGKFPKFLFDFIYHVNLYILRSTAYQVFLRGDYPWVEDNPKITLTAEYQEKVSRLAPIQWILAIPHFIILFLLGIVIVLMLIVSWILVTITGKLPKGLFDFFVGFIRWNTRLTYYSIGATSKYPPFSLD